MVSEAVVGSRVSLHNNLNEITTSLTRFKPTYASERVIMNKQTRLYRALSQINSQCNCSFAFSTSASMPNPAMRNFTTSSRAQAMVLAHKLELENDPMDMVNLEEFAFDDIPTSGHIKLEQDRARLHLLRLIQFQLPQIHSTSRMALKMSHIEFLVTLNYPIEIRRPYNPPPSSHFVELRTQHFLDNPTHPASRKAVLTVRINDLVDTQNILGSKQSLHKFKLLAGPRWDPDKDIVKISCQMFPTTNMNMKWCSDALDRLIKEAEVRLILSVS